MAAVGGVRSNEGMTSNSVTAVLPLICTADLVRLRAFYAEVFGAEQTLRVPAEGDEFFANLRIGAAVLGIVVSESGAAASPGRIVLTMFVPNVDDLLPAVERAGGTVLGPANDMPWGHRVAHVTDPDGNTLNLTQVL